MGMDLNVVYRIPKDLCWQELKRFVRLGSVRLAVYRTCPDIFITKKTIRKAIDLIRPDGYLCIQTTILDCSDVIRYLKQINCKFMYSVTFDGLAFHILVVIYKNEIYKPNLPRIIRIELIEEIIDLLVKLTDYRDVCLMIADGALAYIDKLKALSRYVIAFGNDDFFISSAVKQGLREVVL
jgi:hypothetical protein